MRLLNVELTLKGFLSPVGRKKMKLKDFKNIVAENAEFYAGVMPETTESIQDAEKALACRLPDSLVWLLTAHGYSRACGVESLESAVEATLRCQRSILLPKGFIILNDWNDAGVIVLDARTLDENSDCKVTWCHAWAVERLKDTGEIEGDQDQYPGFAEWSILRLEGLKEE